MAPHSGGHDARGSVGENGASHDVGRQRGQRRQPRAEEDRELLRVCPCVTTYGRSWMFGSLGPHRSASRKTFAACGDTSRRGQGLASWEHLARSNPERKPAKAKRDLRLPRRRTSNVIVIRDGYGDRSERDGSRPLPQGSRHSNRLQWKASLGYRSERQRHGAFVKVTEAVQARVRSAERPRGAKRNRG